MERNIDFISVTEVQYKTEAGERRRVHSKDPVKLAAGFFIFPELLVLSGIGAAGTTKLETKKIIDNPHVGENLQTMNW